MSLLVHLALSMLMLIPAPARCWSNVLGRGEECVPNSDEGAHLKYMSTFGTDEHLP